MQDKTRLAISNLFEDGRWNVFDDDETKKAIWEILDAILENEYPSKWEITLSSQWNESESFYDIVLYIETKDLREYYIWIDTIEWYSGWADVYEWSDELLKKWESSIKFLYSNLT